ncbi:MAG: HEAT repeat domain-containing protein [bacterium]
MPVRIQDLGNELAKTIKAAQIYQTSHPTFNSFFTQFCQDLIEFLRTNYDLILQIDRFSIRYEDNIIYEETEKDISIAFRLFRDGIREIRFTEGITSDELLIFLEIISRTDREQDIALNLWECDFTHISFYVVEEEDEEKLAYALPQIPKLEVDYDEVTDQFLTKEKIRFADKIVAEITPEELRTLKSAIAEDENKISLGIIITTLIDVFKKIRSEEIIDSLVEMLELCINTNDFSNACLIVNQLWNYADINLIARIENEAMIVGFGGLPDTLDDQSFNDFVALVGFFSKKSVPNFVRILRSIKNLERLKILQDRLAYLCQGDPGPLLEFLKSNDIKTLTSVIVILGLIKNRTVIPYLKTLILHPSPSIRIAIIDAFTEFNEAKMVAELLNDPQEEVRIKVLQSLEKLRYSAIYHQLMKTIKSRNFLKQNYNEQRAYFNCLAATHDGRLIKNLEQILCKWVFFGRQRYLIKRQLAAQTLAKIGNEKAIEVLKRGTQKKNEDIRAVCETALKFVDKNLKKE